MSFLLKGKTTADSWGFIKRGGGGGCAFYLYNTENDIQFSCHHTRTITISHYFLHRIKMQKTAIYKILPALETTSQCLEILQDHSTMVNQLAPWEDAISELLLIQMISLTAWSIINQAVSWYHSRVRQTTMMNVQLFVYFLFALLLSVNTVSQSANILCISVSIL